MVKITGDYKAKLKVWALDLKVCRMPEAVGLPYFGHKRFNSHKEMNDWKREYLAEIASKGGVKWKS